MPTVVVAVGPAAAHGLYIVVVGVIVSVIVVLLVLVLMVVDVPLQVVGITQAQMRRVFKSEASQVVGL